MSDLEWTIFIVGQCLVALVAVSGGLLLLLDWFPWYVTCFPIGVHRGFFTRRGAERHADEMGIGYVVQSFGEVAEFGFADEETRPDLYDAWVESVTT